MSHNKAQSNGENERCLSVAMKSNNNGACKNARRINVGIQTIAVSNNANVITIAIIIKIGNTMPTIFGFEYQKKRFDRRKKKERERCLPNNVPINPTTMYHQNKLNSRVTLLPIKLNNTKKHIKHVITAKNYKYNSTRCPVDVRIWRVLR
jgi:hypothetical protein